MSASDDFPMPSLAEFQAMSPDDFERFWRMYEIAFGPPFDSTRAAIEQASALKRAGWKIVDNAATVLHYWQWEGPNDPSSYKFSTTEAHLTLQMNNDIRAELLRTSGFRNALATAVAHNQMIVDADLAAAHIPRAAKQHSQKTPRGKVSPVGERWS